MLGNSLGLWLSAMSRAPEFPGPELRGTGVIGEIGDGTATDATYDTGTGASSISRTSATTQSYVEFPGLVTGGVYRIVTGPVSGAAINFRLNSPQGTIARSVSVGGSVTGSATVTTGTSLFLTCGANLSSSALASLSIQRTA